MKKESRESELLVFPDMVGRMFRRGEAMVADNATVLGDVELGKDSSIWFGVSVRGDDARIQIGARTNIQDNSTVHADIDVPYLIGEGITVGHNAILHGAEIGDLSLIGMGAVLLSETRIGRCCIVGAGTLLPQGMVVPDRSLVLGVPGKVRRQLTDEEVEAMHWRADRYVERARTYLRPQLSEDEE